MLFQSNFNKFCRSPTILCTLAHSDDKSHNPLDFEVSWYYWNVRKNVITIITNQYLTKLRKRLSNISKVCWDVVYAILHRLDTEKGGVHRQLQYILKETKILQHNKPLNKYLDGKIVIIK